jgi:hypothetical protein
MQKNDQCFSSTLLKSNKVQGPVRSVLRPMNALDYFIAGITKKITKLFDDLPDKCKYATVQHEIRTLLNASTDAINDTFV